ncbi:unnamed protein product, partial [Vitis vinifera]
MNKTNKIFGFHNEKLFYFEENIFKKEYGLSREFLHVGAGAELELRYVKELLEIGNGNERRRRRRVRRIQSQVGEEERECWGWWG